jgi:transposase
MAWHLGQAYGQDLRDRVLRAEGSIREVAARFGVSHSYVSRARSRRRRLGEETPGVQCSHRLLKLTGFEQVLIDKVNAVNDLTLKQLCAWLEAEHGMRVGISTLWKTLARLNLSLKKSRSMHPSKRART